MGTLHGWRMIGRWPAPKPPADVLPFHPVGSAAGSSGTATLSRGWRGWHCDARGGHRMQWRAESRDMRESADDMRPLSSLGAKVRRRAHETVADTAWGALSPLWRRCLAREMWR